MNESAIPRLRTPNSRNLKASSDRFAARSRFPASTRDLVWKRSASLRSAERGDTMNDFYPITEDEAMEIVDRIRRESGARG